MGLYCVAVLWGSRGAVLCGCAVGQSWGSRGALWGSYGAGMGRYGAAMGQPWGCAAWLCCGAAMGQAWGSRGALWGRPVYDVDAVQVGQAVQRPMDDGCDLHLRQRRLMSCGAQSAPHSDTRGPTAPHRDPQGPIGIHSAP